jgi:hypothetical protein
MFLPRRGARLLQSGRGRGWCGGARQFPTEWRRRTKPWQYSVDLDDVEHYARVHVTLSLW